MIQLIPILLLILVLYYLGEAYQEVEDEYWREEPKYTAYACKQSAKKREILTEVFVLVFYYSFQEVEVHAN